MRLQPDGDFAARVLDVVDAIPPGRVMTYGDVAAALGSRGARVVGQVMSHYGSDVPWWRVIRAGGLPPVHKEERALAHYRSEGTPISSAAEDGMWRIDYASARWSPGGDTDGSRGSDSDGGRRSDAGQPGDDRRAAWSVQNAGDVSGRGRSGR